MASQKKSILNLPIAQDRLATRFLKPDPLYPSTQHIYNLSEYSKHKSDEGQSPPSYQRRSRLIRQGGQFSWTTPLPLPFPYEIKQTAEEKVDVETWLAELEPSLSHPVKSGSRGFTSPKREEALNASGEGVSARLLGLSQRCLDEVLPSLDAGTDKDRDEARSELVGVLSGRVVILDPESSFAPWSLAYAGHQFGSFAGQLGDGRAITVLATPAPASASGLPHMPPVAELQLKGAGRTPYSRFADGLAVLRSSVREYLGSEAMAALGVPTSRALSLIHLPGVHVARERMETAAIVCRVAPSWIRIGNFELMKLNQSWDELRQLVNFVAQQLFGFSPRSSKSEPGFAERVLRECATRNAKTFAAWQAQGFMHGVLNTDNISILGLTIDYGPYAFMDVFDENHVCNHSDDFGRYSYSNQPSMGVFAVDKLGDALAELIGAEQSSEGELAAGWFDQSKRAEWEAAGSEVVEAIKRGFTKTIVEEHRRLMAQRFGITDATTSDAWIWNEYLDLLERHKLDFHRSFRLLCQFVSTADSTFSRLLEALLPPPTDGQPARPDDAKAAWTSWFQRYEERLGKSEQTVSERQALQRRHNPRFVLRQWILEEAIRRLEQDEDTAFLDRVYRMATNPFEAYGEPLLADGGDAACLTTDAQENARLCEIGPRQLQGFQCSCSS